MKYNFDTIIDRKGSKSIKWDELKIRYGTDDILPMWVADMDFAIAKPIHEAIKERMNHEVFGYSTLEDSYYDSIIGWMKRRHNWDIKKEWIKYTPGVVPAIIFAIRALTRPGDEIIIQTPVYHPFHRAVKDNGCQLVENPLVYENSTFKMDFEDLESKITDRTRVLILCNPHNPVGRVWTSEELKKLGEICLKNNIFVISDEIHSDLVYREHKHTVFATLGEEFAQNSIICTAPSKTFNLAGFQVSNIIIPNEEVRKKFINEAVNAHIENANVFVSPVLESAYNECEEWLEELLDYLEGNKNFVENYIRENIPQVDISNAEGTYLLWMDFSRLNMTQEELREFLVDKCKLGFDDGEKFGESAKYFQRINIACPRSYVEEAMERLKNGIEKLNS